MLGRVLDWLSDWRAVWAELGRIEAAPADLAPAPPAPAVPYGLLGEMGHTDDRADGEW